MNTPQLRWFYTLLVASFIINVAVIAGIRLHEAQPGVTLLWFFLSLPGSFFLAQWDSATLSVQTVSALINIFGCALIGLSFDIRTGINRMTPGRTKLPILAISLLTAYAAILLLGIFAALALLSGI